MAKLTNKLHIKDGDSIYECTCYTTQDEALPTTGTSAGSCWELKNGSTVCYIGLWNTNSTNTPPKDASDDGSLSIITPLVVEKDGVKYKALRYVLNTFNVTIKATSNQSINFTYYDVTNTQQSITVTTEDKTVVALAGTAYTCSVTADTGYTKGTLNGASASGYVSDTMTISASAATINSYLMTVNVPEGATITVGDTVFTQSGSISLDYNTTVAISCASTNAAQYAVGELTANGVEISGDYIMPAGAVTVTCTSTIRKYVVTIEEAAGTKVNVTANDVEVTTGTSYNYGTVLTYSVADTDSTDAYENPTVTAGGN